jgi:F420-dependent oxidoreductase-like protein
VPYDKPLTRTREIVDICRAVWKRDDRLTYEGKAYQVPLPEGTGTGLGKPLKIINHPVRPSIPIWVASLGPKNVEMTAEVADGWLPLFFIPEKAHDVWGDDLARGQAKRDPELGPLQIAAGGILAIGDDAASFAEFARPMAALYIGGMGAKGRNFYNDLVCRYGFEDAAAEIQDLSLDGKKEEAAAKVPAELLELTNLCGPEGFVKERIAAFKEAGVTNLNVIPIGGDPAELIATVKDLSA